VSNRLAQLEALIGVARERHPDSQPVLDAAARIEHMLSSGQTNIRECLDPKFNVFWQVWARAACPGPEAELEAALRDLDAALEAAGSADLGEVAASAADESETARKNAVDSTTPTNPLRTAWDGLPAPVRGLVSLLIAREVLKIVGAVRRG